MATPTPGLALAAVLNELSMLSQDANRSAESWRAEVQKIVDTVLPFSHILLREEGAKLPTQNQMPPNGVASEPEQYYRRRADGGFDGPFTDSSEDGEPFTLEEDAIMRADWERDHASRNTVA
jgi:hypothetical protein